MFFFSLRGDIYNFRELLHGIPVFDDNGNRLGESKVRNKKFALNTITISNMILSSMRLDMSLLFVILVEPRIF